MDISWHQFRVTNLTFQWGTILDLKNCVAGVQLPDHNASSLGGPKAPVWEHSQPEGRPQKWAKDENNQKSKDKDKDKDKDIILQREDLKSAGFKVKVVFKTHWPWEYFHQNLIVQYLNFLRVIRIKLSSANIFYEQTYFNLVFSLWFIDFGFSLIFLFIVSSISL